MHNRLLLTLAIVLMLTHYTQTVVMNEGQLILMEHDAIMRRIAQDPIRFRILVPALADKLSAAMPLLLAHHVIASAALAAFVVGTYRLLARLSNADTALLLSVFVCLSFNVVFLRPTVLAYTWVEAALFVWGLNWLYTRFYSSSPA